MNKGWFCGGFRCIGVVLWWFQVDRGGFRWVEGGFVVVVGQRRRCWLW